MLTDVQKNYTLKQNRGPVIQNNPCTYSEYQCAGAMMQPDVFLNWRAPSNHCPHLHIDLNRLPLSALGVRHPFCVILARVDHRLGVFRLLLQGEGDPAHAHGPAPRWQQAVRWWHVDRSNVGLHLFAGHALDLWNTLWPIFTPPVVVFCPLIWGVLLIWNLLWITIKAQETRKPGDGRES